MDATGGIPNPTTTTSIGLVCGNGRQLRMDTLVRDADAAMFRRLTWAPIRSAVDVDEPRTSRRRRG